ncbi:MAG: DUF6044 family protein [Lachnospiraceae bacterium]|nr:DUF6044 family protein [Lachnospiraceae bacterium]
MSKDKGKIQHNRSILSYWYFCLIGLFFVAAAAVYIIAGEDAHIAVQDDLDLFQAQYQMLKNTGTFFSQGSAAPFLGGVSRDVLPSELSLTGLLYFFLPSLAAYIVNYFLKIVIATVSFSMLAREVLLFRPDEKLPAGRSVRTNATRFTAGELGIVVLSGFAYGILNMFPAFGIAFASIPLFIYLMIRLYRAPDTKRALRYIAGLFVFPFVSYFSYFGLFLLAYSVCALIWIWIRDRRFPVRILTGIIANAIGCVVFEYRLFSQMLFTDTVSIRSTFVAGDYSAQEIIAEILDAWKNGIFHADGIQAKLVVPLCCVFFVVINVRYIVKKQWRGIFHDLFNLCFLIISFDAVIYGIYNFGPFRSLIEAIVPPLRGWQFNRTIFFNPFLWYAAFFLMCYRIYKAGELGAESGFPRVISGAVANLLLLAAIAIVIRTGSKYNDLYSTIRAIYYEQANGQKVDDLSYGDFYSTELFEKIKSDIDYQAGDLSTTEDVPSAKVEAEEQVSYSGTDWAVAYGLHPAVLEYNGIATLDGYLGFYPQSYKDAFRKVIAPALDERPATAQYYDDWGARCYLYSGDEDTIVQAQRNYNTVSQNIMIDEGALRDLGCKYIFSRIELANADEQNLTLQGIYTDKSSPYTIYLYVVH